ncbi:MAG: lipoyl(octanoyl) transferase [Verrucomicrobiota bacterium]|jgi:lipoate-protein ligase A
MLEALHVYDDREPQSAALNMAVDEALLAEAAVPILRFYRWRQPSLSFGYFGVYAEVADQSNEREIVRRWTGGGIVPHGDDLTYSVIIPASHPFFARSSLEIYAALHDAIRRTLGANGVDAFLADSAAPKVSENCFANAVRADLMSGGQKIAGAAHRRSRAGLLHQGSIQQRDLPERFRSDFAQVLCEQCETTTLSPGLMERATGIAAKKYGTIEWLTRR